MRLPILRDRQGRFTRGWHLSTKGYPRYHLAPYRNQYVHRVQASIMLGRPLRKDEDFHHKDSNKQNFKRTNLQVLGHTEHGYVSNKQHYYVATIMEQREREQYAAYDLAPDTGVSLGSDSDDDVSFDPVHMADEEVPSHDGQGSTV